MIEDDGAASCIPNNSTCDSGTYACPEDQGGGCCTDGTVCVLGVGGAPSCSEAASPSQTPSSAPPARTDNKALATGLGVSLPALSIVAGCVVFIWIRNSKRKRERERLGHITGDRFEKPELPAISSVETPEIHSTALYEMPVDIRPQELSQSVDGLPHELPTFSPRDQRSHENH